MGREKTRDILLEAGKRVFLEKGYNNAGLEAILQAAGVPKGSFYYYFESKEDFGLQVLNRFAERYDAEFERCLGDPSRGPVERLRRFFEGGLEKLASQSCRSGCLVGNLSQEMASQSETFRQRLEAVFEGWRERFAACIEQAQRAGEVAAHLDPHVLAEFLLNSWEGAVLRAKTMRSAEPLRAFLTIVFDSLLRP
jgi:TetR/AcrR family transcriptional regulator, transcriptional repressor for nem operon